MDGRVFLLLFGRGACSLFCCLGRGRVLVFAVWAGGVFFFLLFGRGSVLFFCFFFCLGRGRVFVAVWADTGVHSLTDLPGSSSSDPTTKKATQQKQKKKHGFLLSRSFKSPKVSAWINSGFSLSRQR